MSDKDANKAQKKDDSLTQYAPKAGTAWWLFKNLPSDYEKRQTPKPTIAPKTP